MSATVIVTFAPASVVPATAWAAALSAATGAGAVGKAGATGAVVSMMIGYWTVVAGSAGFMPVALTSIVYVPSGIRADGEATEVACEDCKPASGAPARPARTSPIAARRDSTARGRRWRAVIMSFWNESIKRAGTGDAGCGFGGRRG